MSFGKRHGSAARPPQIPSASPPLPPPPPPPPLPGAQRIAPDLIQIGTGEADPAGGAARIERFLLEAYGDAYGVSAETVLSAAGALAGFATQEAIWEGYVRPGKIAALKAFVRVETASGETYFSGDLLNTILASTQEGHLSVWSLSRERP